MTFWPKNRSNGWNQRNGLKTYKTNELAHDQNTKDVDNDLRYLSTNFGDLWIDGRRDMAGIVDWFQVPAVWNKNADYGFVCWWNWLIQLAEGSSWNALQVQWRTRRRKMAGTAWIGAKTVRNRVFRRSSFNRGFLLARLMKSDEFKGCGFVGKCRTMLKKKSKAESECRVNGGLKKQRWKMMNSAAVVYAWRWASNVFRLYEGVHLFRYLN